MVTRPFLLLLTGALLAVLAAPGSVRAQVFLASRANPEFWQPGCVERPGGAPAPKPPQKGLPNVPRYSQPGCIP